MWENSAVSKALDMYAPTIIEADKAESEIEDGNDGKDRAYYHSCDNF